MARAPSTNKGLLCCPEKNVFADRSAVLVAFARCARSRPTPVAPGLRPSAPSASRCALGVFLRTRCASGAEGSPLGTPSGAEGSSSGRCIRPLSP